MLRPSLQGGGRAACLHEGSTGPECGAAGMAWHAGPPPPSGLARHSGMWRSGHAAPPPGWVGPSMQEGAAGGGGAAQPKCGACMHLDLLYLLPPLWTALRWEARSCPQQTHLPPPCCTATAAPHSSLPRHFISPPPVAAAAVVVAAACPQAAGWHRAGAAAAGQACNGLQGSGSLKSMLWYNRAVGEQARGNGCAAVTAA